MEDARAGTAAAEIDVWLRGGGMVVAASERAARALATAFHRARRADGLAAWPAPYVQHWQSFVRSAWDAHASDDRLVMNALQEKALWAEIIGAERAATAPLEAPRQRLADLAMEGHALLCAYIPQFLNPRMRNGWQQDAAVFSDWLTEFDAACRLSRLLSTAQLPLELLAALENDSSARPPLLLAGFDRILPVQRSLFDAWGEWRHAATGEAAPEVALYHAASEQAELTECALWCKSKLAANPDARLLVITQDIASRRGEIERAFLRFSNCDGGAPAFEFSLGVPFSSVSLARGALLILRWLDSANEEHEVDWLLSTGQTTANDAERCALTGFMRALRRHGLERARWTLDAFLAHDRCAEIPAAWRARMSQAKRRLADAARRPQTAFAWAELVPQLLEVAAWPGAQQLASAEFQALRRWEQTLDACASLGFDGRRMTWREFLLALDHTLNETLFAPESHDAPIQIAGPAESAGLSADAIWFMGASEGAWPATGSTNPLLPFALQCEAGMPHSTGQLDWDLARAVTARLMASAPAVRFSYPRQKEGVEMRPSRLVEQLAGAPEPLHAELSAPAPLEPLTVRFEDLSRVPFAEETARGGSTILTSQSQCPFKAFAISRLGAQRWEPARAALTPAQRGQFLHQVLHSVWSPPPRGIRTHAELAAITDLTAFVEEHVRFVIAKEMLLTAREQMPRRYLELETDRLIAVVTEWLEFERTRAPFAVAETEFEKETEIAGLALHVRIDRIDRLNDNDGSFLVIDYKTGNVSTKQWEMPRPENVQLPLYAGFALDRESQPLGGLVFAKVRTGEPKFAGRVGDARATLLPDLKATESLAKIPLTLEELETWRGYIERLARDFLAGRADVDPRDPPSTCKYCNLHSLCRVQELSAVTDDENEEDGDV